MVDGGRRKRKKDWNNGQRVCLRGGVSSIVKDCE